MKPLGKSFGSGKKRTRKLAWTGSMEAQAEADAAWRKLLAANSKGLSLKGKKRRRPRKTPRSPQVAPRYAPVLPGDRTAAFLDLVDCDPWEILDTAQRRPLLVEHARQFGGPENWEMPFGKHKGKKLREIPSDYLEWAVGVSGAKRQFCKFQERCRAELKRRSG